MAIEKKWAAVSAQSLTSDGTVNGEVSVPFSYLFRVGQVVILNSNTQPGGEFKVKRIPDSTTVILGGKDRGINDRSDISNYLTADSANLKALEQTRPNIAPDDVWRAVYDEEPTVALRVIDVDKNGNSRGNFSTEFPLAESADMSGAFTSDPIDVSNFSSGVFRAVWSGAKADNDATLVIEVTDDKSAEANWGQLGESGIALITEADTQIWQFLEFQAEFVRIVYTPNSNDSGTMDISFVGRF